MAGLAGLFVAVLVAVAFVIPRLKAARLAPEAAAPTPAAAAPPPARADPRHALLFGDGPGAMTRLTLLRRFNPPIDPVDTRTFEADGEVVVIADIETPAVQAVCLSDERTLWGCGLMTRAALFNRIRKGVLACRALERPDADGLPRSTGWRCFHDGEEVGLWMIRLGWARPLPGSPIDYWQAAEEARLEKRGAWNGNWTIQRQHVPLPPTQDIAPPPASPPQAPARPRPGRRLDR